AFSASLFLPLLGGGVVVRSGDIAAPPTFDAERFEHVGCPRFDRAGAVGMMGDLCVGRAPERVLVVVDDRAASVAHSRPSADTQSTTLTFFVTDFDEPSAVDEFGDCGVRCATVDARPSGDLSRRNDGGVHAVAFDAFDHHLRHNSEHMNLIYSRQLL